MHKPGNTRLVQSNDNSSMHYNLDHSTEQASTLRGTNSSKPIVSPKTIANLPLIIIFGNGTECFTCNIDGYGS